jgi:hypothetical protein
LLLVVGATAVDVKKRKITVAVAVGSGVSVFCGVDVMVALGVNAGMADVVCVAAALAVCAIYVLIARGSVVGTEGTAMVGTQAMIKIRAENQSKYFAVEFAVFISLFCMTDRKTLPGWIIYQR